MDAVRGEAEEEVAGFDVAARQEPVALHRADGKSREIVVALAVEPGHLGRLAADERCARLAAALGDPLDDPPGGLDVERGGGEIVEEDQRLRTLHDEIVHAHGDEVDADRVVRRRSRSRS